MATSINNSPTAGLRNILSNNIASNQLSALKSGTGNELIYAYQDPAGESVYNNMNLEYKRLEVIRRGVVQSESIVNIVDSSTKGLLVLAEKMQKLIANAHIGYMNDTMIQNTLSPEYMQLKEEFNRIANSASFSQQKLLNGTGGKVVAGTTATLGTAKRDYTNASVATMGAMTDLDKDTAITAAITVAGTATAGTSIGITGGVVKVSGITVTDDGTDTNIAGATITITGATITDNAATPNTAVANIVIPGVDFKLANKIAANGSDMLTGAVTDLAVATVGNITIDITDNSGGITAVAAPTGFAPVAAADTTISGIAHTVSQSGGATKKSVFSMASGADLANDKIEVVLDSARLSDLISALNVTYKGTTVPTTTPTDLTDLKSLQDAVLDNIKVNALADLLVELRANIGAYQSRFGDLKEAMASELEQLSLAKGAIGDADLPLEVENVTRTNVKIKTTIAMMTKVQQQLEDLVQLVR